MVVSETVSGMGCGGGVRTGDEHIGRADESYPEAVDRGPGLRNQGVGGGQRRLGGGVPVRRLQCCGQVLERTGSELQLGGDRGPPRA